MQIKLTFEYTEPASSTQQAKFRLSHGPIALFDGYEQEITKAQKDLCKAILEAHAEAVTIAAEKLR